jgi:ATP-dependent Clp protease ATP-binding subunit ClpB
MLAERSISLRLTPEAERVIAEDGYDPAFGARPLKRSIQRLVQNPLAVLLLEGTFEDGDTVLVTVAPDSRELRFERADAGAAVA